MTEAKITVGRGGPALAFDVLFPVCMSLCVGTSANCTNNESPSHEPKNSSRLPTEVMQDTIGDPPHFETCLHPKCVSQSIHLQQEDWDVLLTICHATNTTLRELQQLDEEN